MSTVLATIAWRLALAVAIAWVAWRWNGAVGLATGTVAFGILLARPLIELAGELRHAMRGAVWKPLEGRHYAWRGHAIQVMEDADHVRWVRVADLRRAVGFTASDGALALSYPSGVRRIGHPPEPHLSDEALVLHLAKERSDDAGRFRNWAEREISFPAKRARERLGIRLRAPTAPDDD